MQNVRRWLATMAVVGPLTALSFAGCVLDRGGSVSQNCSSEAECDDGSACTNDVCGADGICLHTPVDNSDSLVQVPYDCKRVSCDGGREVVSPDDLDHEQSDCIVASCQDGQLDAQQADDGTSCMLGAGSGVCEGGECVVEDCIGNEGICDDAEECTIDSCDVVSNRCTHQDIDNQPSSNNQVGDCRERLCVQGVVQDLANNDDLPDDQKPCTTDECVSGAIRHDPLPQGTVCGNSGGQDLVCSADARCVGCNDPTDCNGNDTACQWRTCDSEICGVGYAAAGTHVQDLGQCQFEECDGNGTAVVVNRNNGTACNDGAYCTGTDSCLSGNCSQHTGDPCGGPDGDNNCAESCNEGADNCAGADPNGSSCNDTLYCNGSDTCQGGQCSQHSGNPCPGPDSDNDCSESCDENNDSCTANDPGGASCNDGTYCNGSDTCQSGQCSQHAGDPCPGPDGDGDCSETCNETNDNCTANDTNGSKCDDGSYCNGDDSCDAGLCNQHAGNPCDGPDADTDCSESCDEGNDNCNANDPTGVFCDNDSGTCDNMGACVSGCGGATNPNGPGQCPSVCSGGCPGGDHCLIDCSGNFACYNTDFTCPSGYSCELVCNGYQACRYTDLTCPSTYACSASCNGNEACRDFEIWCTGGHCSMSCSASNNVCNTSNMQCGTGACTANCRGSSTPNMVCGSSCNCSGC